MDTSCGWSDLSLNESWDYDSAYGEDREEALSDDSYGIVYNGAHHPEYDDTVRRMLEFVFD